MKKYEVDHNTREYNSVHWEIAQALVNIANELQRRNDIEYVDRINFNEDKYHLYEAIRKDRGDKK